MTSMNRYQMVAAMTYAGGKHAGLADNPDWPLELPTIGDTLFAFIMIELAAQEGCTSTAQAITRMRAAHRNLAAILDALAAL
ncbi:hypothetical protein [Hyphomicrobium sp. DY-1]|uniref:hypothetical protein n=1 Tax=Hyphomicrobium sp. DY-1 TaxID=3075650 RepID=UPI0039C0031C